MKKACIGIFAVTLLVAAGSAVATPIVDGDIYDSHSWVQGWYESNPAIGSTFDQIQLTMVNGSTTFEAPSGMIGLSNGWTQDFVTPNVVSASGAATNLEYFSTVFNDPQVSSGFEMLFTAFLDGQQVDRASIVRTNGGWQITALAPTNEAAAVPEPISMIMLGCLGAGMTAARKMRRRQEA